MDIERLKWLYANATPGEWNVAETRDRTFSVEGADGHEIYESAECSDPQHGSPGIELINAELIVELHNAFPEIIEILQYGKRRPRFRSLFERSRMPEPGDRHGDVQAAWWMGGE